MALDLLFIQNNYYNWINIMSLSAFLKEAGYQTEIVISSSIGTIIKKIREKKPLLIGFSVTTGKHIFVLKCARRIKKELNIPIVLGGPHPTHFPEIINDDAIDYICRGEGEEALVDLISNLKSGSDTTSIKNIWAKANGNIFKNDVRRLIDPNKLPAPNHSIYDDYKTDESYGVLNLMASRGCPYHCSFCYNNNLMELYSSKGKYVRFRSPESIITEVNQELSRRKIKFIRFHDDNFLTNKKWLDSFLDQYIKEVKIDFSIWARAEDLTYETCKALKNAGGQLVVFGLETGNEQIRLKTLNKNITNKQIYDAARNLHSVGLDFATLNMLCIPGETIEDGFSTIEMNHTIKPKFAWYTIFHPYPSTQIFKEMVDEQKTSINLDMFEQDFYSHSPLAKHDKQLKKLERLHKYAHWATEFPSVVPLVKLLINYNIPILPFILQRAGMLSGFSCWNSIPIAKVLTLSLKTQVALWLGSKNSN